MTGANWRMLAFLKKKKKKNKFPSKCTSNTSWQMKKGTSAPLLSEPTSASNHCEWECSNMQTCHLVVDMQTTSNYSGKYKRFPAPREIFRGRTTKWDTKPLYSRMAHPCVYKVPTIHKAKPWSLRNSLMTSAITRSSAKLNRARGALDREVTKEPTVTLTASEVLCSDERTCWKDSHLSSTSPIKPLW